MATNNVLGDKLDVLYDLNANNFNDDTCIIRKLLAYRSKRFTCYQKLTLKNLLSPYKYNGFNLLYVQPFIIHKLKKRYIFYFQY